jgi:tight adherence protein B
MHPAVAASLLGGTIGLYLVTAVVFVSFAGIFWMLLGTTARAREERVRAERLRLAKRHGADDASSGRPEASVGWIPATVAQAGGRVAEVGGFSSTLDHRLEQAGFPLRGGEFVVVTVLAAFGGGLLAMLLSQPIGVVLVVAPAAAAIPYAMLRLALRRREAKLRGQLPDVLTVMASSLRAGHSFLQALDTVAKEIDEPAATEFNRVVAEIRLGRPAEDALASMGDRIGSADFVWAVLAINIQREVGGNLAEILDTVADTIRERDKIRRDVDTLTTEGRLSAYVLIAMPFVIALYMALVNPEYIGLLFTTGIGLVLTVIASCLMVAGIVWMRRIIKIDV